MANESGVSGERLVWTVNAIAETREQLFSYNQSFSGESGGRSKRGGP